MKYGFTLLNLILLAACAFFLAEICYKTVLMEDTFIPEPGVSETKQTDSLQKQTKKIAQKNLDIIVKRNLFGVEPEKKEGADKNPVNIKVGLEPSSLSLTLWGTVIGGSQFYAVIEDKTSRVQALYQEGDVILDARVKKIMKMSVVLTYQGKDQILEIESDPKNEGPAKKSPGSRAVGQDTPKNQSLALTQPFIPTQPQHPQSGLEQLISNIKLRPFFSNGSPDGVMVYSIRPESVFNRAGLRNGDILKFVDGISVVTIDDASSLLSDLENPESTKLTVIRGGETKEISYNGGSADDETRDHAADEGMKEEKIPDPQENGVKAAQGSDSEPDKAEISENKN